MNEYLSFSFLYLAFCLYLALDMLVHMGARWVRERVPHAERLFRALEDDPDDRRNILEEQQGNPMSYSALEKKLDQQ